MNITRVTSFQFKKKKKIDIQNDILQRKKNLSLGRLDGNCARCQKKKKKKTVSTDDGNRLRKC